MGGAVDGSTLGPGGKSSADADDARYGAVDRVLERSAWEPAEAAHQQRVDELTAAHRERSAAGVRHPVEDFLFTYYSLRPSQLRRWHPGLGVALLDADQRADWRFYRQVTDPRGSGEPVVRALRKPVVVADPVAFCAERGAGVRFISRLLRQTSRAPGQFGCFGLHEWAMVYQRSTSSRRHPELPLRLGAGGTDEVVRSHSIRCSHFDAFRFFSDAARPLNLLSPDIGTRAEMEQPGCLHVSMDLYKWAFRLLPLVSSSLLLDCFELAREVRKLDMRASPYDLSALGYRPVTIETAAGKAEYVAGQRACADRAAGLRVRLLTVLDRTPIDPTAPDQPDLTHDQA